jgi:hypothetical protein
LILLPLGCSASPDTPEIEIPFALLSSDELQPVSMTPCTYVPITGPGSISRAGGLLELDAAVNPSPSYVLAVQVVNSLPSSLNDESPVPSGPIAGTFLVSNAVVTYIAQQSFLAANVPAQVTVPVSGTVMPGGIYWAGAILVPTMNPDVIAALSQNLVAQGPGASGDLILEIQLDGTLEGSGESMVSNVLSFPLHVCLDCGVNPLICVDGVTAVPSGHGPCCAPQDFFDVCVACGGAGEPCCAPPETVPATCSRNADCQSSYGASSICDDDAGVCTPGCDADSSGKPLTCGLATGLPEGTELCSYLNSGGLTSVCGSP